MQSLEIYRNIQGIVHNSVEIKTAESNIQFAKYSEQKPEVHLHINI